MGDTQTNRHTTKRSMRVVLGRVTSITVLYQALNFTDYIALHYLNILRF